MRSRSPLARIGVGVGLAFAMAFFLFPVGWTFSTSLKQRVEIGEVPPTWVPANPTLENYAAVVSGTVTGVVGRTTGAGSSGFLNSLIVAALTTNITLLLGIPASYGLARLRVRGAERIAFWILSTRMLPPAAAIIPLFLLMLRLRLIDTRLSLVLVYVVYNLSFVIWIMRGFFRELPVEVEEAARVDGASLPALFWRILIPLAAPGITATAVFTFIFAWNEFLLALVLTRVQAQTFPVQISGFIGTAGILWGEMAASGIVGVAPVFMLALLVQRYLVRGLTLGGIKG